MPMECSCQGAKSQAALRVVDVADLAGQSPVAFEMKLTSEAMRFQDPDTPELLYLLRQVNPGTNPVKRMRRHYHTARTLFT